MLVRGFTDRLRKQPQSHTELLREIRTMGFPAKEAAADVHCGGIALLCVRGAPRRLVQIPQPFVGDAQVPLEIGLSGSSSTNRSAMARPCA